MLPAAVLSAPCHAGLRQATDPWAGLGAAGAECVVSSPPATGSASCPVALEACFATGHNETSSVTRLLQHAMEKKEASNKQGIW